MREAIDISSVDEAAVFPDEDVPGVRKAVNAILEPWKELARRLLLYEKYLLLICGSV